MPGVAEYRAMRRGNWRLVARMDSWNRALEEKVMALVREQPIAKHPQVLQLARGDAGLTEPCYLKIFHPQAGIGSAKDLVRMSKAFRFWRQALSLTDSGFNAPTTLAAGELRRWGFLQRAFILTGEVSGQSLPEFLHDLVRTANRREYFIAKRDGVSRLAQVVREFHRRGFVHGDLVASNLFISRAADGDFSVCFMDNDRTRRYPAWFCQSRWKRNLIQLNRMPLRGVTLQDRMRFLRAYLARNEFGAADRRFARWLELKTRKRRRECDGAEEREFRELMRWKPGSAAAHTERRRGAERRNPTQLDNPMKEV